MGNNGLQGFGYNNIGSDVPTVNVDPEKEGGRPHARVRWRGHRILTFRDEHKNEPSILRKSAAVFRRFMSEEFCMLKKSIGVPKDKIRNHNNAMEGTRESAVSVLKCTKRPYRITIIIPKSVASITGIFTNGIAALLHDKLSSNALHISISTSRDASAGAMGKALEAMKDSLPPRISAMDVIEEKWREAGLPLFLLRVPVMKNMIKTINARIHAGYDVPVTGDLIDVKEAIRIKDPSDDVSNIEAHHTFRCGKTVSYLLTPWGFKTEGYDDTIQKGALAPTVQRDLKNAPKRNHLANLYTTFIGRCPISRHGFVSSKEQQAEITEHYRNLIRDMKSFAPTITTTDGKKKKLIMIDACSLLTTSRLTNAELKQSRQQKTILEAVRKAILKEDEFKDVDLSISFTEFQTNLTTRVPMLIPKAIRKPFGIQTGEERAQELSRDGWMAKAEFFAKRIGDKEISADVIERLKGARKEGSLVKTLLTLDSLAKRNGYENDTALLALRALIEGAFDEGDKKMYESSEREIVAGKENARILPRSRVSQILLNAFFDSKMGIAADINCKSGLDRTSIAFGLMVGITSIQEAYKDREQDIASMVMNFDALTDQLDKGGMTLNKWERYKEDLSLPRGAQGNGKAVTAEPEEAYRRRSQLFMACELREIMEHAFETVGFDVARNSTGIAALKYGGYNSLFSNPHVARCLNPWGRKGGPLEGKPLTERKRFASERIVAKEAHRYLCAAAQFRGSHSPI